MIQLVIYLFKTLFFRISLFFRRWYVGSFYVFLGWYRSLVITIERSFALRANLHFLFSPLYQERNIIGYVLGFSYRGLKLFFGGFLYCACVILLFCAYCLWIFLPILIVAAIIKGQPIPFSL